MTGSADTRAGVPPTGPPPAAAALGPPAGRRLRGDAHLATQLLGFLDAMDLGAPGRRPLLVAHSSGAAVAAEATLRAPGRIAGLLMLDGDALNTGAGARPAAAT